MPPKETHTSASSGSGGGGTAEAAAAGSSAGSHPAPQTQPQPTPQPQPQPPPARGLVPSRGAAFAAGIGRGATPPGRGAGPHFVPKRIQRTTTPSTAPAPPIANEGPSSQPAPTRAAFPGRGRGAPGARGGGRGGARAPIEMTASGPFALGTGAVKANRNKGSYAPILAPASRASPVASSSQAASSSAAGDNGADRAGSSTGDVGMASGPGVSSAPASASSSPALSLKTSAKGKGKRATVREDSIIDLDDMPLSHDGLRVIDIQDVPFLDERAPAVIPRGDPTVVYRRRPKPRADGAAKMEDDMDEAQDGDGAEAVDLSESDHEEEEPDDLAADFLEMDGHPPPDNRLYLFQIPKVPSISPYFQIDPDYVPPKPEPAVKAEPNPDEAPPQSSESVRAKPPRRSVSFAADTFGGAGSAREGIPILDDDEDDADAAMRSRDGGDKLWRGNPEGQIGEITVWRDGSVKMHLGDVVMNLSAGLQHTFLQHIMALDAAQAQAFTLGEVHRKFIATPDVGLSLSDYAALREEERVEEERVREEEERARAEEEAAAAEKARRRRERAAAGASAAAATAAGGSTSASGAPEPSASTSAGAGRRSASARKT